MSELSVRIKKLIESSGYTYRELEERSGVPRSAIQRYATGYTDRIPLSRIEALADALNSTAAYILGWNPSADIVPLPASKAYPIIGDIACGSPIDAVQNTDDVLNFPDDVNADVCLRCKGDSMLPTYQDGDLVFIRRQPTVENGQIAAVMVNGSDATLKKFYRDGDQVTLTRVPR